MENQTRNSTQVLHRLKLLEDLLKSQLSDESKVIVQTGIAYCKWFLSDSGKDKGIWYKE